MRVENSNRSLKGTVADQSTSIAMLRERALAADANLRRLIDAVERLCQSAQPGEGAQSAETEPGSFQDQLAQAMRNPRLVPEPRP
jgi:hypothetical protein